MRKRMIERALSRRSSAGWARYRISTSLAASAALLRTCRQAVDSARRVRIASESTHWPSGQLRAPARQGKLSPNSVYADRYPQDGHPNRRLLRRSGNGRRAAHADDAEVFLPYLTRYRSKSYAKTYAYLLRIGRVRPEAAVRNVELLSLKESLRRPFIQTRAGSVKTALGRLRQRLTITTY